MITHVEMYEKRHWNNQKVFDQGEYNLGSQTKVIKGQGEDQGYILNLGSLFLYAPVSSTLSLYLT
jgi:Cu2+-containing amine oxidase